MPDSDATSAPPSRVSSPVKQVVQGENAEVVTIPTSPTKPKKSTDKSVITNGALNALSRAKTGPGSSKQPKNSSPRKISFNLNELPPNLSQYIQELAASTAEFTSGKNVGAPMREVSQSLSPKKLCNVNPLELSQRRHTVPPLKDEEGALKWFYHGLSSAEHTSLIDFYNFLTEKLPALFSQLKNKGSSEMHDLVQSIQMFIRTFSIISRVHRNDEYVVFTCESATKFLLKAEKVVSIHSILPGLGDQCVALIERAEVSFLIGNDEQKSAVSILSGCRRSCSNEFALSGNGASTWRSHNRKRQHSRGNREDNNSNKSNNQGKKKWDNKSDKKSKNPKFTGEN